MSAIRSLDEMRAALAPQASISRRLSVFEYGHAAAGAAARTLDPRRIITMVLEGESKVMPEEWNEALRRVADANPGLCLRVHGLRQRARWTSDGALPPQVRIIENCQWDGTSHRGVEVIEQTPLPLQTGPCTELIVATGRITRLILRTRHALMDGMGVLHFFQELFRALRGEPLLGTNAGFSDVDLMHAIAPPGSWKHERETPIPLTGGPRGATLGDVWQRLTFRGGQHSNLMGRVAELSARYAWSFNSGMVRIAVPVSLRRHLPDLHSTMNFSGLLHVGMRRGETADDFRRKLGEALAQNRHAVCPKLAECIRYLPFAWLDGLTGRTPANYLRRKLLETVLITNLGVIDMDTLACARFRPRDYYCLPVMGNSFIALSKSAENLHVIVGMPAVYASEGRFERFLDLLREEFRADGHSGERISGRPVCLED